MIHALDLAARLFLAPVLLAQAVRVRQRTLLLPEAAGQRDGRSGTGATLRVLIVGDSSAAGVGVAHQDRALAGQLAARLGRFHTLEWRLLAQTGATTATTLDRLAAEPGQDFDLAIVALGVNDVTRAVPLELWLRRQKRLHALLQQKFGVRQIYLSGLPPMGHFPLLPQPLRWILGRQASRFDRNLARLAALAPDLVHVPLDFDMDPGQMAPDGFHPGPDIYAGWARALVAAIEPRFTGTVSPVSELPDSAGRSPGDRSPSRPPA